MRRSGQYFALAVPKPRATPIASVSTAAAAGNAIGMTSNKSNKTNTAPKIRTEPPEAEEIDVHDDRVARRALLRPAEKQAGSDDPEGQARAILQDSERRQRRAAVDRDPETPVA